MANTLKFGNGEWYGKKDTILAYNDENSNYKPLPFDFSRASKATVVNKDGLIEEVGSGQPRIDYKDNSKGALLLEPSRSNLQTYSSDLSSVYVPTNITQTSNYGASPDGSLTSTRVVLANLTDSRSVETLTGTLTNGVVYTFSCYYKGVKGESTYMNFLSSAGGTNISKEIIFTGKWQRESITFTAGSASNYTYIVDVRQGVSTATDFKVWGAQVEQGSYATSYIPTSGSAVTRLTDICNNGGNDQVINSTEGVLYAEFKNTDTSNYKLMSISDGTDNNRVFVGTRLNTGYVYYFVVAGGATQASYISTQLAYNFTKVAVKYKANDFSFWINGLKVSTDSSGSTPTGLDSLQFNGGTGTLDFHGNCKDLRVYNTALTDSELATLTTI